jgi:aryl-alcohol dehydrogenase-like predicted oxidoreductase
VLVTRTLGRSGLSVSALGLGSMQFSNRGFISAAYPALPQSDINAIVKAAYDGGISWFDTAEMYGAGTSERCLAHALADASIAPEQVVIATKWRQLGRTASSIERTFDDRVVALSPYRIDLHQIHWPVGSLSTVRTQMRAMGRLAASGKIRAVGVSNFSSEQMRIAHDVLGESGIGLATNQVRVNLLHRKVESNGVLDTARLLGITLIAYSPLASGLLTGKFHDNPETVAKLSTARRLITTGVGGRRLNRTKALVRAMREIAAEHQATVSQVALAWLTSHYGETMVAIPGATRRRQAAEAAAAMGIELLQEETEYLAELSAGVAL